MSISDLKKHGLSWRLNGLPIYDSNQDLKGVVKEPLWLWSKLTDTQKAAIKTEAYEVAATGKMSYEQALPFICGHYGVSCPHNWINHLEPHIVPWRECEYCLLREMLSGMVVNVGDRVVRVSDPPPAVYKIPLVNKKKYLAFSDDSPSAMSVDIPCDVYRWNGKKYIKQSH